MKKEHGGVMRMMALILAIVVAVSYTPNVMAASKAKVKSVTVTNLPAKTLTLKKGKSMKLKVKVTGSKKVSQKVTYKSSKPKIAAVTSKGKVSAKKNGKAKITITSKADKKKKAVITVTVGTPVSKVTLNKKKLNLETGKTATLKAAVSPKKASNKKIVWTTSNKKVATVSSKGKVKAVAAGKAKITAAAADGSGKKKTINVVVTNPIVVTGISVVNPSTVKVDLSGAKALNVSNFTVKLNMTGKGSYNKVCKLDNVVTQNNQSYLVVLDAENPISDQENVQVTVTGLGSNPSVATTTYNEGVFQYTESKIYRVDYNEAIDVENIWFEGIGYSACSVQGLPNGIKADSNGMRVEFKGKPQQKGKVISQVVTMDEVGNTHTYSVTWLIGSPDTICVAGGPYYLKLNAEGVATVNASVRANGGSGSYKYSLTGNTYGLQIDQSGTITGSLMAAGTYNLSVNVQDANNPALNVTDTVVINVSSAVTVSGIVKDMAGNPVPYANLSFINKDKANKYVTSISTQADSKGAFSVSLVGGVYDIRASYNGSQRYLYAQNLDSTRSGFDISLALQKVVIYSNNPSVNAEDFGTWYDEEGESYGSGNMIWLKVGNYALTATRTSGRRVITAKINVNVTAGQAPTVTAAVDITTQTPDGTVTADQPVNVALRSEYKYYVFTPSVAGTYHFYSESSTDTYGCLEDIDGRTLRSDDDEGPESNFYFTYECEAGVTYYVGIRSYGDNWGEAVLHVTSSTPSFVGGGEEEESLSLTNSEPEENNENHVADEETKDQEEVPALETEQETEAPETAPEDTAEEETAPEDTAEEETAPQDTAEEEAAPEDTAEDTTAQDTVEEISSQETSEITETPAENTAE